MPVDSSSSFQTRRSSRKPPNDDEIDLRRARGEVCAIHCSILLHLLKLFSRYPAQNVEGAIPTGLVTRAGH
jgi:hypothetical protein